MKLLWRGSTINTQFLPRVKIDLGKIAANLERIIKQCDQRGIRVTAVTKGVCGSVEIARILAEYAIHSIGDSHIQNIRKMREAGIDQPFMLLRSPMLGEIEETVQFTDISMNSELATLALLNQCAAKYDKIHEIILMVELGDRREGILPEKIDNFVPAIKQLGNLRLIGVGSNLTCLNGVKPNTEKMERLSTIAVKIESKHQIPMEIVSGGNSANYQWLQECQDPGMVNHLRIGEIILFGTDPIAQAAIPGFEHNAFSMQAEVIESKRKPSKPEGEITFSAFGDIPQVKDEGMMNRAILAIGQQDVDPRGCQPIDEDIAIIGATSDHLIINSGRRLLKIGELVEFRLHYRALLPLMVSPYVEKLYVE